MVEGNTLDQKKRGSFGDIPWVPLQVALYWNRSAEFWSINLYIEICSIAFGHLCFQNKSRRDFFLLTPVKRNRISHWQIRIIHIHYITTNSPLTWWFPSLAPLNVPAGWRRKRPICSKSVVCSKLGPPGETSKENISKILQMMYICCEILKNYDDIWQLSYLSYCSYLKFNEILQ